MANLNRKEEQTRAQDYVTNKLLCVFTIAFIMIIALMNVGRMMRSTDTFVATFRGIGVFTWVMLGLTIIAVVLAIMAKVRGKDEKYKLVTAKHIAVILGFITACSAALAFAFNENTISLLYIFIPAVTVLFIIYHTFPRDFFVLSLVAGFGAIGLWLMGSGMSYGIGVARLTLVIGALLAMLVVATVLTIVANLTGGKIFGQKFFNKDSKYALLYIAYALVLALMVVMWFVATPATYYCVFALLAYIILTGVYYAVKMM